MVAVAGAAGYLSVSVIGVSGCWMFDVLNVGHNGMHFLHGNSRPRRVQVRAAAVTAVFRVWVACDYEPVGSIR